MGQFMRGFKNASILTSDKLYTVISDDIKKGFVFPALRNGYVDFYYKGGRLFQFKNNEFKTHIKYASVIAHKDDQNYLTATELNNKKQLITDFTVGYKRIKENCALHSGVEAEGVARIYSRYSYAANAINNSGIVVLDVEIAFDTGTDRIDLLLYNKTTKTLRFYEAKHYSNKELWSKAGINPKVISQLNRYNSQIKKKEKDIVKAYGKYVDCVNKLFGLNLPIPLSVDAKTALLIFGFDRDQVGGRFKNLLVNKLSLQKIPYYAIGNIKTVSANNMWKNTK